MWNPLVLITAAILIRFLLPFFLRVSNGYPRFVAALIVVGFYSYPHVDTSHVRSFLTESSPISTLEDLQAVVSQPYKTSPNECSIQSQALCYKQLRSEYAYRVQYLAGTLGRL